VSFEATINIGINYAPQNKKPQRLM